MSDQMRKTVIDEIAGGIDIPESAYEKAENRYNDLAAWFGRLEARCNRFSPHIYPQGSFRLGTVVRPLNDKDDYDLDLGCRLEQGVSKTTHTQKQLKTLVGLDLEEYRKARGIENVLDEKHRCWRLKYADEMNFHMDVVPSIPEEERRRQFLKDAMIRAGSSEFIAQAVAKHAGAITDNRRSTFGEITADWKISNSEGYALWFESQMKLATVLMEKRASEGKVVRIDDLPARKWKSPLQHCVQILKRHRDIMFSAKSDSQPISIIITTLAAKAYQGESDIEMALQTILSGMANFVKANLPRIPNPVNIDEDFADRWATSEGLALRLEENFWKWLTQAKADFGALSSSEDVKFLTDSALKKYGVTMERDDLQKKLGLGSIIVGKGLSDRIPKSPVDPRGGRRFG